MEGPFRGVQILLVGVVCLVVASIFVGCHATATSAAKAVAEAAKES